MTDNRKNSPRASDRSNDRRRDRQAPPSRDGKPQSRNGKPSSRDGKPPRRDRDDNDRGSNDRGGPSRPPEPPAPIPGFDARQGALEILERVGKGESLTDALNRSRAFSLLEGADRAFARAMASAALRRRGSLDHIIGGFIDRPLPRRASLVMDILRLTAAQLLILKTPDHAAVSIAVSLAQARQETANYAKLVNAVSRKIAKTGPATLEKLPARTDTPSWMWRGWERAFGPLEARKIAEAHRAEAALDLTVKSPDGCDGIAESLGGAVLFDRTVRLQDAASVETLDGFTAGTWWVQDAAAALPARLLGDIAGKSVLDLCAAPGGKTMQLAAAGAQVTAVDISPPRLEKTKENLDRTGLTANLIEADFLKWTPQEKVDAVLLDAPCSASGTVRRHPDLPWIKTEDDVTALAKLQAQMIDRALGFLKPGGVLIYCVCSLQPEEGERQAKAALERHSGLERLAVDPAEISEFKAGINRQGDLRTLPYMNGGMDGFFAARFILKGA